MLVDDETVLLKGTEYNYEYIFHTQPESTTASIHVTNKNFIDKDWSLFSVLEFAVVLCTTPIGAKIN